MNLTGKEIVGSKQTCTGNSKTCTIPIINLQEGIDNTITAKAKDQAGNEGKSSTLTVTVKKKNVAEVFPQGEFGEYPDGTSGESGGPYVKYLPGSNKDSDMDINGDGKDNNDWRLFYNDGKNVFLIAADYVLSDKVPYSKAGMSKVDKYSVKWNSYPESQWAMTTETNELFMYKTFETEINEYNARCVSTLLKTGNWTSFVNPDYADVAIGGSTLEMWIASWNSHNHSDYPELYIDKRTNYGFYIGKSSGATSYYVDLSSSKGYQNKLYFPHNSSYESCYGYWLAAPSASNSSYLVYVHFYGRVNNIGYNYDCYRCAPHSSSKV